MVSKTDPRYNPKVKANTMNKISLTTVGLACVREHLCSFRCLKKFVPKKFYTSRKPMLRVHSHM